MGHNPEAKSEQISSPYDNRIAQIQGILKNIKAGEHSRQILNAFSNRDELAERARQRKIISAAQHLNHPELMGFAKQHALEDIFQALERAATENKEAEVLLPSFDTWLVNATNTRGELFQKEGAILAAETGHKHGIEAALLHLSDPLVGIHSTTPDITSGIFTTFQPVNGILFLQAPTSIPFVDINHYGSAIVDTRLIAQTTWLTVSPLPKAA